MNTRRPTAGFTLVEVMVASGIVVVIMGVLLAMTDQTQRLVKATSAKVEQFQDARVGFESMTRRLAQATLNAFWDYRYVNGVLTDYQRSAELRFRSGRMKDLNQAGGPGGNLQPGHGVFFQTPNGLVEDQSKLGSLDHLINTWGYFVELGSDAASLPAFLQGKVDARKRFRLMELMQPSEKLSVYNFQGAGVNGWFAPALTGANRPVRVLTENVVALIVLPRLSLADEEQWKKLPNHNGKQPSLAPDKYAYDSTELGNRHYGADPILNTKNQLPPVVQVIMVAIDETSARQLEDRNDTDSYLGINYESLFTDPSVLEDVKRKAGDLSNFEKTLINKKISYRIFATNVSIRGAKWSRSQTN